MYDDKFIYEDSTVATVQIVVNNGEIIDNVIIAIVAGGNVLLEGIPGVGKTRLVRSLGRVLGLPFSRIQFTPDLLPLHKNAISVPRSQFILLIEVLCNDCIYGQRFLAVD